MKCAYLAFHSQSIFHSLDTYSGFGAQYCSACPVGSTCDDPSLNPSPCNDGTYWTNSEGVSLHVETFILYVFRFDYLFNS